MTFSLLNNIELNLSKLYFHEDIVIQKVLPD